MTDESGPGTIVDIADLSVTYPRAEAPAVAGITLTVFRGDRLLLLGPSGSGKSTLLYAMAGIIPSQVSAKLDGSIERHAAKVGVVLQNPEAQMIAPTVEEEIAFALENEGIPAAEIEARVTGVLQRFGIAALRKRSPSTLSGGECQKVSLAAAVAVEPEILFLDEPTAFLDPRATRSFFELLEALDPAVAVVMVEHKIEHVRRVLRRYLRIDRVEGTGSGVVERGGISELSDREEPLAAHYWFTGLERPAAAARHEVSPLLEVERLGHTYAPATAALTDVGFSVYPGETFVVMGPNGSGKSTLLDRIAALAHDGVRHRRTADPAPIRLHGRDVRRISGRRLYMQLFLMPQNPEHLFLKESVADEIALQDPTGLRSAEAAELFGLTGIEERSPYSLSEGEKRRLNLCCAHLDPRELLLLDEPTYGLDAAAIVTLVKTLELLRKEGRTVVVVTHSPELAHLVADRLLVLTDGRVRFVGTPAELAESGDPALRDFLPQWLSEVPK